MTNWREESRNHLIARIGHLSRLNRHEQAIAEIARLLAREPDNPKAHVDLAYSHWQLGNGKEAINAVRGAIRCDPEFADAHVVLSMFLERQGALDAALWHARIAARLDPKGASSLYQLSRCQAMSGEAESALKTAQLLVQTAPNECIAHDAAGFAAIHLRRWSDAETSYREALARDPNHPVAFHNLALLHRLRRKHKQAIELLHAGLRAHPDNGMLRRALYRMVDEWISRRSWFGLGHTVYRHVSPEVRAFYRAERKRVPLPLRIRSSVALVIAVLFLGGLVVLMKALGA